MSRIRGRGNRDTELALARLLRAQDFRVEKAGALARDG
ncbi:MAG: hypothetical protein HYY24_06955 [Verrucomicrobia bacterium]|nr:hypothetical protein [Verrucomicrobiota bacterium]